MAYSSSDLASTGELGGVLLQLENLTQLRLAWQMDITVRAALGLMTQLRELYLQRVSDAEVTPVEAVTSVISLPPNLTRLEMNLRQVLDKNHAPDLATLAVLQHLQLVNIKMLALSLLSSMQQLTHLHVCMDSERLREAGMAALLDVLPRLQELQHLELKSAKAQHLLCRCSSVRPWCHVAGSPACSCSVCSFRQHVAVACLACACCHT
jgi:hypothetical protein